MSHISKNSVALAGEFAVLSQLALRGYDANMVLGRTKGVDILVSDPRARTMYRLEVKTRLLELRPCESKIHGVTIGNWMMNKKHEDLAAEELLHCFVAITKSSPWFRFFVLPSVLVASYVEKQHAHWLKERDRLGNDETSTDMRVFRLGLPNANYEGRVAPPLAGSFEDNWTFNSQAS